MHTFVDNQGRTWTIAINTATIRHVRGRVGVNLLDVVDADKALLRDLSVDPCLLADVLWALVEDQADKQRPPVTDVDFGRALAGDSIDHATTALLEDLCDFFPSPKRRVLATALGKVRAAEQKVIEVAASQAEAIDPEALAGALLATLGKSSTS